MCSDFLSLFFGGCNHSQVISEHTKVDEVFSECSVVKEQPPTVWIMQTVGIGIHPMKVSHCVDTCHSPVVPN